LLVDGSTIPKNMAFTYFEWVEVPLLPLPTVVAAKVSWFIAENVEFARTPVGPEETASEAS
jgi:hypothetical protein